MNNKPTYLYFKSLLLLVLGTILFTGCGDKPNNVIPDEVEDPTKPFLTVDENNITMSRIASEKTISFKTNIPITDISINVPQTSNSWCKVEINTTNDSHSLLIKTLTSNTQSSRRSTTVSLKGGSIQHNISITQEGKEGSTGELLGDIELLVSSAYSSSFQSGEGIEKSIDGNLSTIYHSNWTNTTTNYFPITLSYNFENIESMDYLVYHPRSSGTNGNIKEFDLFIATVSNPNLTLYGSYNFQGISTASLISFTPALIAPTKIEFRVKSGVGNYVSCAEMKFLKKNPDGFDPKILFVDNICTQLKPNITLAEIENVDNEFFKNLAMEIYKGEYNTEFRVQEYKAWQNPDMMAAINKTNPYSLRDNPTGIYANDGEDLIVFVEDTHKQNVSLLIQDLQNGFGGQSFPLKAGMNKLSAVRRGLVYIIYHTANGTEKPIKINIATGSVNGYFDSQKHTKEDWSRLLGKAIHTEFDLVGKDAHLTFLTANFRSQTPDGLALINKYDELVRLEQEFMGLYKYNRAFKNRMYFHIDYGNGWMYAAAYHTGYVRATMDGLCNLNRFTIEVWGPAHEVGHINQTRPGFKWAGMTEVTNNIHSLYVQTSFGNASRLMVEDRYSKAKSAIIDKNIAHNAHDDVFDQLVPFWQLKLYMHDAQNKPDFYKDLYQKIRENPNPATDGLCQIEFVKVVCDVAKLDLIDFFEVWGFLTPINKEIDDYGKTRFIVTQAMIDSCKEYINSKKYAKPRHKVQDITDNNISNFK